MSYDVTAPLREPTPQKDPVTFCEGCEKLKRCQKYRGGWFCEQCKAERQP